ncbi:NAD(P)/FAD-dependent oxidoreductase [Halopenitus persicus]|uniref:UDP-galactopyranose mutase n=1 Tax=Halopenitus persicus TaxID=1048396 RepID=A0A1H3IW35_9EURY|nr:NAD(P)/FAD-dependent oxidoreductase [Halopenitus persicus]SDY31479.1 UDP-galactopyranose mutase [Halopenitus persicus]
MNDTETAVAVVGAGPAGLVAAARLGEAGADVTVLEREDAAGGRVRSRTVDGFTIDRGFQVLFDSYPAARAELDLEALDLRAFAPGAVICRPGSRSTLADPFRDPGAALEAAFSREITLGDKLRTLRLKRELLHGSESKAGTLGDVRSGSANGADESIRSFLRDRGFSEAYLDRFVAPFYGGITLDRSLSTSARVFVETFRAMSDGRTVVPAAGMGAITRQLADRARDAGCTIRLETAVEGLTVEESATGDTNARAEGVRLRLADGSETVADAAVVAASPPEARRLTDVESIPTDGVGCVTQWYTLPPGRSLGIGPRILLNAGDERPNTVAPLGAVAPEYAPDGRTLLAATFVDDDAFDRDDATLAAETERALASWFPERSLDGLRTLATDRTPFAQFAQPPGFRETLPDPTAPAGPVVLAGEYTRWSSIQGALASGRRASEIVLESVA